LHAEYSKNEEIDKCALFNIGEIYHLYLGDHAKAAEALELFRSKYPADPLAAIASFLLASPSTQSVRSQPSGGRKVVTKDPAPTGFVLASNYPNPFNPSTQISYSLPEAGKVSLVIYDVLGREITTIADAIQPAGRYSVIWNSTQSSGVPASSGICFARLRVTNELGSVAFTKTSRLLLIK
jgi:hypothetical protein